MTANKQGAACAKCESNESRLCSTSITDRNTSASSYTHSTGRCFGITWQFANNAERKGTREPWTEHTLGLDDD
jgi:hypothetical protein